MRDFNRYGDRDRLRQHQEEDIKLAKELLSDAKEKAEHLMLVDLGRNDLGRVCEYGTVEVVNPLHVERYSHVIHIVSNVQGKLRKGKTPFDALMSIMPAGTAGMAIMCGWRMVAGSTPAMAI